MQTNSGTNRRSPRKSKAGGGWEVCKPPNKCPPIPPPRHTSSSASKWATSVRHVPSRVCSSGVSAGGPDPSSSATSWPTRARESRSSCSTEGLLAGRRVQNFVFGIGPTQVNTGVKFLRHVTPKMEITPREVPTQPDPTGGGVMHQFSLGEKNERNMHKMHENVQNLREKTQKSRKRKKKCQNLVKMAPSLQQLYRIRGNISVSKNQKMKKKCKNGQNTKYWKITKNS